MKLFAGGIAFLVLATGGAAYAQDDATIYTGNGSGSFEDPNDFSNGAPNANLFTYIITGGAFTSTSQPGVDNGTDTFTITESTNDAALSLYVGSGIDLNTNTLTPGTVNLVQQGGTTLTIGQDEGEDGSFGLDVTNSVTLNLSGGTVVVDTGGITVGDGSDIDEEEGETGNGTLVVSSEHLLLNDFGGLPETFAVGINPGGVGVVTETGDMSTVVGDTIVIGSQGATGTYNLQGGLLRFASVTIADTTGSVGTLKQTGGSFVASSIDETFVVGSAGNGTYIITAGAGQFDGDMSVGDQAGGVGSVQQSGGTVTVDGLALVGNGGTGTYSLSSGTATFEGPLDVGEEAGSHGTFTQTGGSVTVADTATIGDSGTGTYNISAGTAQFNGGITIGAAGTLNQTGGTVTIGSGDSLDLTAAGGNYNLNGGTLQVSSGTIVGSPGNGRLNFGGGTLQITSTGTFTDSADGTLSVNSTIDASNGGVTTATFSGNLSGSGGLVLDGSAGTTFQLTGNNTYTGATEIENGTLIIDPNSSNAITSSSLMADGGTTIDLNLNAGGLAYGGGLNGSGTINVDFVNAGDALVVKNTSSFNGALVLGANGTPGVLQVFNGTVGDVSGNGSGVVIGGTPLVAFPNGTSVPNSGTVTFTGAATYTGATTINPGFTLLAPSLNSPTVNNTGTLGSTASVGTVFDVGVGGLGNLNMPEGANQGTLLIRLADANADRFDAGTANLFGTVKVSGFTTVGTTNYDIVDAGALTTGTLNTAGEGGLDATANSALLSVSLSQEGDQLILTVNQKPITDFAKTPNQRAVAEALDVGLATPSSSGEIFTALNALTASQIPGALDQLTPRPYLYMRDIAFENSTFLAQRLDGVLANIRTGFSGLDTNGLSVLNPGMESSLGQSLGSLLAYNNERSAPNGVNYYPVSGDSSDLMQMPGPSEAPTSSPGTISDSEDPRMAPTVGPPPSTSVFDGRGSGFNEFLSGDVILGDLNQNQSNNGEPKAHYTAGNATAGVSFRMTSNLVAGVLFDYNHTDAKTDPQDSHVKVDSYSPGLFATFFEKGFYANGLFTFGYNDYSDNRNVSFGGTGGSATSSPSGQQYAANLSGGYDFHPNPHWVVGPTASLGYTHLDIDSFTETGAGPADLSVDSQSADSLRARIGGHVLYQVHAGSILFQPNLSLSYQHEFLNDDFNLDSQLNIPGTPGFATQGTNPGRDTGLISLGLTATLDNSMSLYLDYLAEYGGSDYFIQSVEGGVKASF